MTELIDKLLKIDEVSAIDTEKKEIRVNGTSALNELKDIEELKGWTVQIDLHNPYLEMDKDHMFREALNRVASRRLGLWF